MTNPLDIAGAIIDGTATLVELGGQLFCAPDDPACRQVTRTVGTAGRAIGTVVGAAGGGALTGTVNTIGTAIVGGGRATGGGPGSGQLGGASGGAAAGPGATGGGLFLAPGVDMLSLDAGRAALGLGGGSGPTVGQATGAVGSKSAGAGQAGQGTALLSKRYGPTDQPDRDEWINLKRVAEEDDAASDFDVDPFA